MTHEDLLSAYRITVEAVLRMAEDDTALRRENRLLRAFLQSKGVTADEIDRVLNPRPVLARSA